VLLDSSIGVLSKYRVDEVVKDDLDWLVCKRIVTLHV
jgi:hypothetical protein